MCCKNWQECYDLDHEKHVREGLYSTCKGLLQEKGMSIKMLPLSHWHQPTVSFNMTSYVDHILSYWRSSNTICGTSIAPCILLTRKESFLLHFNVHICRVYAYFDVHVVFTLFLDMLHFPHYYYSLLPC